GLGVERVLRRMRLVERLAKVGVVLAGPDCEAAEVRPGNDMLALEVYGDVAAVALEPVVVERADAVDVERNARIPAADREFLVRSKSLGHAQVEAEVLRAEVLIEVGQMGVDARRRALACPARVAGVAGGCAVGEVPLATAHPGRAVSLAVV